MYLVDHKHGFLDKNNEVKLVPFFGRAMLMAKKNRFYLSVIFFQIVLCKPIEKLLYCYVHIYNIIILYNRAMLYYLVTLLESKKKKMFFNSFLDNI